MLTIHLLSPNELTDYQNCQLSENKTIVAIGEDIQTGDRRKYPSKNQVPDDNNIHFERDDRRMSQENVTTKKKNLLLCSTTSHAMRVYQNVQFL